MDSLPRRLEEDLRSGKVVPFVGGGVSMAVRSKKDGEALFPGWKEILGRAVNRLNQEGRGPYAKIVDGLIEIGPEKYLDAAKHARDGLTGGLWFAFLRDQLDIPHEFVADDSLDLARAVWQLGSSLIITTNHDRVLRWACPQQVDPSTWDIEAPAEQADALRKGESQRPTIWHLHGWVDNSARIILTPDGYQRLYPEAGGENVQYQSALKTLRGFMTSHTLLFIGFSLDDPYIGMQLRGLHEIFQGATGPHYALVRAAEYGKADSLARAQDLPIQIVTFQDFGEPLLELVKSLGRIATAGQKSPVGRGPVSGAPVSRGTSPPSATPDFGPANYVFYVPYRQKGDQVVGREEALEEVHRQIIGGHRRTHIGQTAAFQGLGGLGKTQLAVEYAYRYRDEYPNGVIWINADQDIEAQLSELSERARWVAPESEHRHKLEVARRRLKTYSDCLIIFDNLEDVSVIQPCLPEPQADPHILVTSRSEQPGFTPLPMDLLDEGDSLIMLTQEAGRHPESDAEWEAARKIVRALGGLPLALELAGGYLRHRHSVTWEQYHQLLDQNLKSAMPGRFLSGSFTNHEADVYSTLKLNEEFFAVEPLIKEVVDLFTWSASSPMGLSLLQYVLGIDDGTALTGALGLGVELRLLQKTPGEERYALHRLVREVRREDVPLDGRPKWTSMVCQQVGKWFQQRRRDFSDLLAFELEIDHLQAWQKHAVRYVPQQASRLAWLQGYPVHHRGQYSTAKGWVEWALHLHKESGLHDKELEAHLIQDLGACYGELGNHRHALEYLEKAVGIYLGLFGEKHSDTALAINDVGLTHAALGEFRRAFAKQEQALEIRRELFGERHPDTARSLIDVGSLHGKMGEHRRALAYQEQALTIYRELFGEKHPHTAMALNNVGVSYRSLGEYRRALEYQMKAMEAHQGFFREKHPHTATALDNQGVTYLEMGDYQRALEYLRKALEIRRELFGENHPHTAISLNNVGSAYGKLGEHTSGLDYQEKALEIRKELFGEKHHATAASLHNLGTTYGTLGDHRRALEYQDQALGVFRELFGDKHPDTATALNNLGTTYGALGDHRRALEYQEPALAIQRELLGDKHPDTVNSVLGLAIAYTESGHAPKAVRLLDEFLDQLPREQTAYSRLRQRKLDLLARMSGGGFRQQPRQSQKSRNKRKRR